MVYESVLLFAVLWFVNYVLQMPLQRLDAAVQRAIVQLIVILVGGVYFVIG